MLGREGLGENEGLAGENARRMGEMRSWLEKVRRWADKEERLHSQKMGCSLAG